MIMSKKRKILKQLASTAYERELTALLEELGTRFNEWQAGKLSPWDLNSHIHRYHDGNSRDLWKKYNCLDPAELVGFAVVDGIVQLSEVPEIVRELVETRANDIRLMRESWEEDDADS
jgi:hypothetical protein